MKKIIFLLLSLATINSFVLSKNDSNSTFKPFFNHFEIGSTGMYFFDGRPFRYNKIFSPGTWFDLFSYSYTRNLQGGLGLGIKYFGFYYAGNFDRNDVEPEKVRSMNVFVLSFVRNMAQRKPDKRFHTHFAFDLNYRRGYERKYPSSGWYNSPGLGATFGIRYVMFKRLSVGTELTYAHFFFQKDYPTNSGPNEQLNVDILAHQIKIGCLF